MWRSSRLIGYGMRATDGSIGQINDFLFDEEAWTIRWAVIDTGTWLPGRKVLLPPAALGRPDVMRREIPVDLTREQIEGSPSLETDAPVSRRMEGEIYGYHGWQPYWGGGMGYPGHLPAGAGAAAAPMPPAHTGPLDGPPATPNRRTAEGEPQLRSTDEVTGYYAEARDGNIGHIEDFLVEDKTWVVRYLIIDTKNWWPGKMVLISPHWLSAINWAERQVTIDALRDQVKNSPEYEPATILDRNFEERLYHHYGYPPYWASSRA